MTDLLGTMFHDGIGPMSIGAPPVTWLLNGGLMSLPGLGVSLEAQTGVLDPAPTMTFFSGAQTPGALVTVFPGLSPAGPSILSWDLGGLLPGTPLEVVVSGIPPERASLVREVIALLKAEATRRAMPSISIDVSRFDDPEEGESETVVTQKVHASSDRALAYWDEVGRTVQAWTATLGEDEAHYILERVAINIDWTNGDDASAV